MIQIRRKLKKRAVVDRKRAESDELSGQDVQAGPVGDIQTGYAASSIQILLVLEESKT
ncbi:hypothetical protein F511_23221 [Dorcoceras hygrometricum]|uniref:Uncharacterized protein n=1 Tax=Dorcoceras hygrometricum TaxID=472368 RepID=A0A2Z7BRN4_9LAMI|nr:hypothetical protein F511_23221 [Dorcoceras hygrometricum]